jgi:predicted membrane-bound mannosyltransferase
MHLENSIFRSIGARQERQLWRLSIIAAASAITLGAIYVDGYPPKSRKAWLGIKDAKPVAAAMLPHHEVPGQVTMTLPKQRGNSSSLSLQNW